MLPLLLAMALGPTPVPSPAPASTAPTWSVSLVPAVVLGQDGSGRLDEGLLDPEWFGPRITFRQDDEVDFVWMQPGLNLKGRSIQVKAWEDPVFLRRGRDEADREAADRLTSAFPPALEQALERGLRKRCTLVRETPDFVLVGRFVDVNAGNRRLKEQVGWGAGAGTATWDLKLVEARTGRTVLAAHHRVVSLTLDITLRDRLEEWARTFSHFLSDTATK